MVKRRVAPIGYEGDWFAVLLFDEQDRLHDYKKKRQRSIDLAVCAPDEPCVVDLSQRPGTQPRMSHGNNADLFAFLAHGIPWNMEVERIMTIQDLLATHAIATPHIPGTDWDVPMIVDFLKLIQDNVLKASHVKPAVGNV